MKYVKAHQDMERRNFFRIDDIALLCYRPVAKEEVGQSMNGDDQLTIDKLSLKARFDSISRELQPLFRVIEAGSPEIAQYLSSLDRKLNLLSEYYVEVAMGDMDMRPQKINLGAGGLSFISSSPIMAGSLLELRMVLLPENYGVYTYARVVNCVRCSDITPENTGYKISVEYERMSDEVRDIITRHVLNKEQLALSKNLDE
jgi:c-di-GMP-binding flagellar brake protein YcgR